MRSGLAVPVPSVQRQPQELAAPGIIPSQKDNGLRPQKARRHYVPRAK
jgi:hypothetical protein